MFGAKSLVLSPIFFISLAHQRKDWNKRCLNVKVISNITHVCPLVHVNFKSVAQRISLPKIDTKWHLRAMQKSRGLLLETS